MKKQYIAVGIALGLSTAFAAEESLAEKVSLVANVQTQGSKALYDNDKDNNLDGFWFRANFGVKYSSDNFDGNVTIRMYAPAFGNTIDGSDYDKFQADTYFGNYKWNTGAGKFNLKLGHWKTDWSVSGNFGTYIDKSLSKRGFMNRDQAHDALEGGWATGPSQMNVMVATGDGNFNTGYVRVEENIALAGLKATVAYRSNVIDPIQNTAEITHRIAARASYEVMKNLKVYGEVAIITTGDEEEDHEDAIHEYGFGTTYVPFFVGVEIPTVGILDNLYAEFEYIGDRDELNSDADEIGWSVGVVKKLGSKTKLQVGLYSETEVSDVALAARVTSTLQ